ncbi:MAG: hypothetical protein ABSA02_13075 [Trebonia sp.]
MRHHIECDLAADQVGLPLLQAPRPLTGPGHPVRAASAVDPAARGFPVLRLCRAIGSRLLSALLLPGGGPDPLEVLLRQQAVGSVQVAGEHRPARQVEPGRDQVVVDLGVRGPHPGAGLVRPDARRLRPLAVGPKQVADVMDQDAAELRRGPGLGQLRVRVHPPAFVDGHGTAAPLRDHLSAEHRGGQVGELGGSPQPGRRQAV